MTRPRLLDLYCGAGGAAKGYHDAGFDIVGVDIADQPRYPYDFIQLETSAYLRLFVLNAAFQPFDAIHASPPCQLYSALRLIHNHEYLDLIAPTRKLLDATGLPWVIENVPGAPIRKDYLLCGSMFGLGAQCRDGEYRQLRRHRWFETNWPGGLQPECQHEGHAVGVYGDGGGHSSQVNRRGAYNGIASECADAMGIDWMTKAEVSQAIPPAYTEYIGRALLEQLRAAA